MEDPPSMPQNGGQQANERIERNSSGQAIHQQISSSATVDSPGTSTDDHIMIRIENSNSTNGIPQEAAPSVPSTSNSKITRAITPASRHNSAGTSRGQSPPPNEVLAIPQEAAPSVPSTSNSEITRAITPASRHNSAGTSRGQSPPPNEVLASAQTELDKYRSLRQAASEGDWPTAEKFYALRNDCVRAPITTTGATVLHVAVAYQKTTFIKKWLELMKLEDLELKNKDGFTALHTAARVGNVRIAEQLVEKNDKLPSITDVDDRQGDTPLIVAAYMGQRNMVRHLFSRTTPEQLADREKRIELLLHTIRNDMYDIALDILKKYSDLTNADTKWKWEALETLANKPFKIGSESQLSFWKRNLLKYSCLKGIYNKALMKASAHQLVEKLLRKDREPDGQILSKFAENDMALIFEAAKAGNVEFLIIISRSYPDILWKLDKNDTSIFHTAIFHRQESVFNLIYEIGADMHGLPFIVTNDKQENMLHLAGNLATSDRLNIVSGAALQMQRELLWFKEIEKIVPPSHLKRKNREGKTPKEKFVKEHENLQKDGEKWMKDTANYCMIVATLIATVMFAAAFTLPGGSDENKGTPIFLRRSWFMIFFISDVIALCSSSTSIVFFLSILTSRYREDDFLKSLPLKLLFGLATLLISMTGMMVAFIANLFLVYTSARTWTLFVVLIPIILFCWLHCKIWVDTFCSTSMIGFLFRPHKHRLLEGKQKGTKVVGGSLAIEQGKAKERID